MAVLQRRVGVDGRGPPREMSVGPPASGEARSGQIVDGKYRLVGCLGEGGMGIVYEAVHLGLGRHFALKRLRGNAAWSGAVQARFRREAEALGRLRHPHIVQVTDFGVDAASGGAPYLVMERLEGETLAERLRREGPLPWSAAADVLRAMAAAVDHAHASGVLHRDLKPQNVCLGPRDGPPGEVKILDFGVAQFVGVPGEATEGRAALPQAESDTAPLTLSGAVIGTPCYAAPEVLESPGSIGPASDIYSLGVVAYEILVGRPPYSGSPREVFQAHVERDPPDPASFGVSLPAPVVEALLAPLRKEPARRPATARAAVEALARAWRSAEAGRAAQVRSRRRRASTLVVSGSAVVLSLWLADRPPFPHLEARAADLRLLLGAPRPPDPRLAVVLLDDASLDADPTPLGQRAEEFSRVLEVLFDAGARAVAVDLLLPEAWSRSEAFSSLVLRHRARLVLAALSSPDGRVVGAECLGPLTTAALGEEGAASLFGYANLEEDDGVVRWAATRYEDRDGVPRASWTGRVAGILGLAPEVGRFRLDAGIDEGAIPVLSWAEVSGTLRNRPEAARDRLVLVGADFVGSGDEHRVPGWSKPRPLPGVLVHALILGTLLQGAPGRETPELGGCAAAVFAVWGAWVALRARSAMRALLGLTGGGLLLAASGLGLWSLASSMMPIVWPLVAGVVAFVASLPLRGWTARRREDTTP